MGDPPIEGRGEMESSVLERVSLVKKPGSEVKTLEVKSSLAPY